MAAKRITVTVSGPAHIAEIVKCEVATALSHLGAFEVTASGEFFNGSGQSCDPERLQLLSALAATEVEIYVQRK
jgi:hypothetical protein